VAEAGAGAGGRKARSAISTDAGDAAGPLNGSRVAVLLCGYGEVEDNDDLADYNARSLELLVSKSIKFPDVTIPFLSRRLAKRAREEYERANRFTSPHNAIFERQRTGIEGALRERYGDSVRVFRAFNFCDGDLPEQVLPAPRR
jgi:protoporphyrin/coproporphyrin ferrochelatase